MGSIIKIFLTDCYNQQWLLLNPDWVTNVDIEQKHSRKLSYLAIKYIELKAKEYMIQAN